MPNPESHIVRRALGAGRWFPGDREELQHVLRRYVEEADAPAVSGRIVSAISPHAGYLYSGKVAGHTFRAIRDNAQRHGCDTVVILGGAHRDGFGGVALMDGDSVETPLGLAALDRQAAGILTKAAPRVRFDYAPHAGEHSAENQIPFAQFALPETKLIVGLIGDHASETLEDLQRGLLAVSKSRRIVVVASTDLLHDPDYERVCAVDAATMAAIVGMERVDLETGWSFSNQTCCGIRAVLAAMRFAESQGVERGAELCYCNSGDDFPESRGNWVVGYGAVVFGLKER